ncbi:ATP-binding protein [Nisaea sp.]|uniref:sensor histidine kinase n=1 Tax=Nisaea sp. TaxID=2024842 RepID=UPI003B52A7EF
MLASFLGERKTRAPVTVAVLAFLIVLAASLYAQFVIEARDNEERSAQHAFARAHIAQNLQNYLDTRFRSIRGLVAQLASSNGPTRETKFVELAQQFHENFNGVQAVNWVDRTGVARWIVPLKGNEAVKDKDLSALDEPGAVIEAVRQDRRPHATGPITLLQSGSGFAAYFPVLREGDILGLVNVVFRFDDLVDSIAELDPRGRISVGLFHGDRFVAEQSNTPDAAVDARLSHDLVILDQIYRLEVRAHGASTGLVSPMIPVLIVNILFAGALFLALRQVGLLAQSEARFRDHAEIAFDYLWETDADQRFTYLSGAFEKIVGRPASDFLGRRLAECDVTGASESDLREHSATMGQQLPFANFVFFTERRDGSRAWISSSGKPLYSSSGQFIGYRGADRSIDDQVATERRLRKAWEHAEAANRAKSNFLAGMSHELRTPLNSIIGFSEIIRDQMLGPVGKPQYVEYANDVVTSGRHLLSLVDDVLDLSKIESSTFELSEDEVELATAFEFVRRGFRRLAESRGIAIETEVAEAAAFLRADTRLIRQMVMNLVSNAIKFTDHGGKVVISAERDADDRVHIKVRDTGIGIPKEHQSRVLEPFVQVRESALLSHEGSGLGLSLVKRFVELHGGTIDLQSDLDRGTAVDLTFPANRSLCL